MAEAPEKISDATYQQRQSLIQGLTNLPPYQTAWFLYPNHIRPSFERASTERPSIEQPSCRLLTPPPSPQLSSRFNSAPPPSTSHETSLADEVLRRSSLPVTFPKDVVPPRFHRLGPPIQEARINTPWRLHAVSSAIILGMTLQRASAALLGWLFDVNQASAELANSARPWLNKVQFIILKGALAVLFACIRLALPLLLGIYLVLPAILYILGAAAVVERQISSRVCIAPVTHVDQIFWGRLCPDPTKVPIVQPKGQEQTLADFLAGIANQTTWPEMLGLSWQVQGHSIEVRTARNDLRDVAIKWRYTIHEIGGAPPMLEQLDATTVQLNDQADEMIGFASSVNKVYAQIRMVLASFRAAAEEHTKGKIKTAVLQERFLAFAKLGAESVKILLQDTQALLTMTKDTEDQVEILQLALRAGEITLNDQWKQSCNETRLVFDQLWWIQRIFSPYHPPAQVDESTDIQGAKAACVQTLKELHEIRDTFKDYEKIWDELIDYLSSTKRVFEVGDHNRQTRQCPPGLGIHGMYYDGAQGTPPRHQRYEGTPGQEDAEKCMTGRLLTSTRLNQD